MARCPHQIKKVRKVIDESEAALDERLRSQDKYLKDVEKRIINHSDRTNKSVVAMVARINTLEEKLEKMDMKVDQNGMFENMMNKNFPFSDSKKDKVLTKED